MAWNLVLGAARALLWVALGFFMCAFIVYPPRVGWASEMKGAEIAAWVQAIFSVIAILAAGAFTAWQLTLAEQKKQDGLRATLLAFANQASEVALNVLAVVSDDAKRRGAAWFDSGLRYQALATALERFPAEQMNDQRDLQYWLLLTNHVRRVERLWAYIVEKGTEDYDDWEDIEGRTAEAHQDLLELTAKIAGRLV